MASPTSASASGGAGGSTVASKKAKRSETGSDNDWHYLLGSGQHLESGQVLSFLLGMDNVNRAGGAGKVDDDEDDDEDDEEEEDDEEDEDGHEKRRILPASRRRTRSHDKPKEGVDAGALFPFFPAVVAALHTMYEGMKVDQVRKEGKDSGKSCRVKSE